MDSKIKNFYQSGHSQPKQEISAGAPENELRLVMIGRTGKGKSKTGSTIFGQQIFPSGCSATSLTTTCQLRNETRFGKQICVVDTPGVFDNRNDNESVQKDIKNCICLQSHGQHAVILSLPIGRFTEEDEETVKYSQSYLVENLVGMILIILPNRQTNREKKVQVISKETAKFCFQFGKLPESKLKRVCSERNISGPVRMTKTNLDGEPLKSIGKRFRGENPIGTFPRTKNENAPLMKSHGLEDFEKIKQHCYSVLPHADKTKLPVSTKIILDSMIISGGMEQDTNYVSKRVLIKCQMCIDSNEALYWCNTCRRNICNFCKLYHEKVWIVKNHNVQALL